MIFRRFFSVILCLTLLCGVMVGFAPAASAYSLPDGLTVHASSAAVIFLGNNYEDDVYLYEKDADSIRAPAALVRLMAAAYTLQQVKEKKLDMDTVSGTYTLEMFNKHVAGTGVNAIGMEFGETWKLRDLLTVSLIQTASDASTTLAYTVSGDVKTFVQGMNELAKEIGCKNTHFANVTGLDSLSQYTTVRDVHRILRYCMSFPGFEEMISQKQYTVQPLSGGQPYNVTTRLDMLRSSSPYRYSPLKFGRTGLSGYEGWSLATVASDSGYDYMVIVLGCPSKTEDGKTNTHYTDTIELFRWAFRNFTYKTLLTDSEILGSVKVHQVWGKDAVNLIPKAPFSTVVYNEVKPEEIIKKVTVYPTELTAPVEQGTVYGKVELFVNVNEKIGEMELIASETLEKNALLAFFAWVGAVLSSPWLWLSVGLIIVLVGGYIALAVFGARRHNRKMNKGRKH